MAIPHRYFRVLFVLAALAMSVVPFAPVGAQPLPQPTATVAPKPVLQGVAVLAIGNTRDDAFALARATYGSSLRPRTLDELRARILAGDPAPAFASKELRELAELRASIAGDDAASRRLLASIAQQIGVQALLVVGRVPLARPTGAVEEEKRQGSKESPAEAAGGSSATAETSSTMDAGGPVSMTTTTVAARLFLADSGDFDAARYESDGNGTWRGTVTSLSPRFLPPPAPAVVPLRGVPAKLSSEGKETRPFYASPWLWGAVGAAVLIGGFFYFASQDTSEDSIHLQMKVPR